MNKEAWLKFIRHSTEAHHIREIFNGTYALLEDGKVQRMFLDRIESLLITSRDPHTRKSLEDLKEDIELEIEHGEMRKSGKPFIKTIGRPYSKDQTPQLEKILSIIEIMQDELEMLEKMVLEYAKIEEKE